MTAVTNIILVSTITGERFMMGKIEFSNAIKGGLDLTNHAIFADLNDAINEQYIIKLRRNACDWVKNMSVDKLEDFASTHFPGQMAFLKNSRDEQLRPVSNFPASAD